MRDLSRTFRYDRIKSCVDLETGEVVHDVSRYLNEIHDRSPERTLGILYDDFIDILDSKYEDFKLTGTIFTASG